MDKYDKITEKELKEWMVTIQNVIDVMKTVDTDKLSIVAGIADTLCFRKKLVIATALYTTRLFDRVSDYFYKTGGANERNMSTM